MKSNSPLDEQLIAELEGILVGPPPAGRQHEQVTQEFLEQHSEFIPTPNLLNHHLHFQCVVAKFPLGTELKTDYLYITKSSDRWRITLVELELPTKRLFSENLKYAHASAEFNGALDQVRSWKRFVNDNREEIVRRLEPLLQPLNMRANPIEFDYQLIIGRSKEKN